MRVADLTEDAFESQLPSVEALLDWVRQHTGASVTPDTMLYRVEFHCLPQAPAKPQLSLDEVRTQLEGLDRGSGTAIGRSRPCAS